MSDQPLVGLSDLVVPQDGLRVGTCDDISVSDRCGVAIVICMGDNPSLPDWPLQGAGSSNESEEI